MENLVKLCKENGDVEVVGFKPNEVANYLEGNGYVFNESESRAAFGYSEITLVFDGVDGQFEIYIDVGDFEVVLTFIPAMEEDF